MMILPTYRACWEPVEQSPCSGEEGSQRVGDSTAGWVPCRLSSGLVPETSTQSIHTGMCEWIVENVPTCLIAI
jgi:hypothetical protein